MGLSLGKLLVLIAIVLVVWYSFKYTKRVEAVRRALRHEMAARQARARPQRAQTLPAEDLVKCDRCGAYVAVRSAACGRPDCPRGR